MLRNVELGAIDEQRNISGLEGCEHAWNIRDLHILQSKFDLFLLEQNTVRNSRVSVFQLIVAQFRHVFLAHEMNEQGRGKREKRQERPREQHHDQRRPTRRLKVMVQHGLAKQPNGTRRQRETLHQFDLRGQNTTIDGLFTRGILGIYGFQWLQRFHIGRSQWSRG